MRHLLVSTVLVGLAFQSPAFAQNQRMESVVVTASMGRGDFAPAPAIYRLIPADFVSVEVTFQTGTRDNVERRKELEACFDRLLAAVNAKDGFELEGGDIGESSAPIDSVLFSDVYIGYGDRATFTLTLVVDTRPDETFDQLMVRASAFLKTVKPEGRAESYLGSEQYLGARNMGAHRKSLLNDIKAEIMMLRGEMGASHVTVEGLDSRVVTHPSGPLELQIYIPYDMTVEWGERE